MQNTPLPRPATTTAYTFFSTGYRISIYRYMDRPYIGPQSKCQWFLKDIIQSIFFDHGEIKLEINNNLENSQNFGDLIMSFQTTNGSKTKSQRN